MTRSEKKKQKVAKWIKYKLEIIDKFEHNIKKYGFQQALIKTDEYIKTMCTIKYTNDKEIILNCANEFINEFKSQINKRV